MADEKRAPVQGYSAGIPWSMHLRAYDAYCKKYGPQQALIDLEGRNCRGGFGIGELDEFIPGWREKLSEITRLTASLAAKEAEVEGLREALEFYATEAAQHSHFVTEGGVMDFEQETRAVTKFEKDRGAIARRALSQSPADLLARGGAEGDRGGV